jgi:ADP-ribose pyrophosphatase
MRETRGPYTILDRTVRSYDGPLREVREDRVVKPDGSEGMYVTAGIEPGVLALAVDDDGTAYLTKQFRYAAGEDLVETAAGAPDDGEEPLETAKRELEEELGITARSWTDLGTIYPLGSLVDMREHLFLARDLEFGESHPQGSEDIELVKVPLAEAVDMAVDGRIRAAGACVAVLRAARLLGDRGR